MDGSQILHQVLKTLCHSSEWKYAVFWKLQHRARMVLTWGDAYYDNGENPEKKWFSNTEGNLHSHDPIGLAVAKMSYHVYSLGEGIVGQVAVTGKHMWICADERAAVPGSPYEYCDGWKTQFSAGIKTIAVIAVVPHGVLLLGSFSKIAEDLKVVNHVRDAFFELHGPLNHLPAAGQVTMEKSCLSDTSVRTSLSDVYHECIDSLDKMDGIGIHCWPTVFQSLGKPGDSSYVFSPTGSCSNKTEVINKHGGPVSSMPGFIESRDLLSSCAEALNVEQLKQVQMEPIINTKCIEQDNSFGGPVKFLPSNSAPSCENVSCSKTNLYDTGVQPYYSVTGTSSVSPEINESAVCEHKDRELGFPKLPDVHFHKDSEKNLEFYSPYNCTNTLHEPSRFCAGYELYEALGPVFGKQNTNCDWDAEKNEPRMASELPEQLGGSSPPITNSRTEHLLEAVVANINHNGAAGIYSDKSVHKSVESILTTENVWEACTSDVGTISSAGYSLDKDTLSSLNSSSVCSFRSPRGLQSNSSSRGSEHMERHQEAKTNKKRARPGESCRPRPRDRQLIQDRIKELRELVPNGSKCSIDSLLERTIKHMLFMQSITKHADKLNQCTASKLLDKESGMRGSSSHDQGSSWAVEVGSNLKVCPIIVENINMNGQMLIEMMSEECSLFLEIAEAIRSLGLTILKGITEGYGEKIWMRFVVEGQNNRSMHRMDILWSLMQLLQPKADA